MAIKVMERAIKYVEDKMLDDYSPAKGGNVAGACRGWIEYSTYTTEYLNIIGRLRG